MGSAGITALTAGRKKRVIAHVDMDAFFAAIEQRDDPRLKGKPVIVGADPKGGKGRGVVSTASYEARRYGIRSAMPISEAYRKCPKAVFMPVRMSRYEEASADIYRIFYSFTPDIEPVGIDEAFLDIRGTYHLFGSPLETCIKMKSRIREETSLTASVGIAPTKMAAKIASDLKKPDGLVEVSEEGLEAFLNPLDIGRIPGLGEKSRSILNKMGIETIGQLAARSPEELESIFGSIGVEFFRLANGIDERPVVTESEAKSISNEVTFERDTLDAEKIASSLMHLAETVSQRLRRSSAKARTITLKIRVEGFHTYTRSHTLDRATNFVDAIYAEAKRLYDGFDLKDRKVRLVGVRASNLAASRGDEGLFEDKGDRKKEGIYSAVDRIKDKFGDKSIYMAGGFREG